MVCDFTSMGTFNLDEYEDGRPVECEAHQVQIGNMEVDLDKIKKPIDCIKDSHWF